MSPSSYLRFAHKVSGSGWSPGQVKRAFFNEVDPHDYKEDEAGAVLEYMQRLALSWNDPKKAKVRCL